MQYKRIIPCLDVKCGQVVKGKSFRRLAYAGDALSLAKKSCEQGADELVFLDIAASAQGRSTYSRLTRKVAQEIFIPFTVGGGIRTLEDAAQILQNGADKISINTAAVENPLLIPQIAEKFGSQAVVVAIDAKRNAKGWSGFTYGGRKDTGIDAVKWAKKAASLGAGEILLTSMDQDGTNSGYDIALSSAVCAAANIPLIASGGAGSAKDICSVFKAGADAALLAGILHRNETTIPRLKKQVASAGIPM